MFEQSFEALKDTLVVRGSTIVAELLPPPEIKTAGGLILSTPEDHIRGSMKDNLLHAAKVLATGPGYWNEGRGEYEALEVQAGSIIVLPQYSAQTISFFPGITRPTQNKLVLVKMDSILCYYKTEADYQAALKAANAT